MHYGKQREKKYAMKNLINKGAVDDSMKEYEISQDPWDWENHCSACDWFGNKKKCPHYNRVKNAPETYWRDIGCDSFWD